MLKIGLTGNLYSGYEDVSNEFKKLGVPVFDADVVSKFMIHYDESISKEIRIRFGNESFNGEFLNLNFFSKPRNLELLLTTIHKKLIQSWEKFRLNHKESPYIIFKYSLLYERGIDKSMNYNMCVFRPKDERVEMLKSVERLSYMDAYSIVENGPDDIQKNKLSTYIIHNYLDARVSVPDQVKHINSKLTEKVNLDLEPSNDIIKNIFT